MVSFLFWTNVFRPLSEDEVKARTMISCDESKQQVIATQNIANKLTERVFVFDKVCFCSMMHFYVKCS